MGKYNQIKSFLEDNNISFQENVDLKTISYSCTGGNLKLYILPSSKKQLESVINLFDFLNEKFILSGGTSNLLFLDFVNYKYLVSTHGLNRISYSLEDRKVSVDSGVELSRFVRLNLIHGAVGFEGLEGIPGSIGGAIFQNAGAYGYFISDHLIKVDVMDSKGNVFSLKKDECNFSMRSSIFQQEEYTILGAEFTLPKGDVKKAAERIETYHIARHSYQEWVYPNLGSVFVTDTNVYDSFSKSNRYFKLLLIIIKLIMNNPIYKRVFRKKPSNYLKNNLVECFFDFGDISDTYSHKSINTFLNRGNGTLDILRFYCKMDETLGDDARLENEIVFSSLDGVVDENKLHIFKNMLEKHPRVKDKIK